MLPVCLFVCEFTQSMILLVSLVFNCFGMAADVYALTLEGTFAHARTGSIAYEFESGAPITDCINVPGLMVRKTLLNILVRLTGM